MPFQQPVGWSLNNPPSFWSSIRIGGDWIPCLICNKWNWIYPGAPIMNSLNVRSMHVWFTTCVLTSGTTQGIDDRTLIQKCSCNKYQIPTCFSWNISDIFVFGLGEGGSWMALKKSTPGDIWNPGLPCSRKDVAGRGKLYRHDAKEDDEYNSELELRSSRFWDVLYKIWLL